MQLIDSNGIIYHKEQQITLNKGIKNGTDADQIPFQLGNNIRDVLGKRKLPNIGSILSGDTCKHHVVLGDSCSTVLYLKRNALIGV